MLKDRVLFKCSRCHKLFRGEVKMWRKTDFVSPLECPRCGKMHTYPLRHFLARIFCYRDIWKEIDGYGYNRYTYGLNMRINQANNTDLKESIYSPKSVMAPLSPNPMAEELCRDAKLALMNGDVSKATSLFEQAAVKGSADAPMFLAVMCFNREIAADSYLDFLQLLETAIAMGSTKALLIKGYYYTCDWFTYSEAMIALDRAYHAGEAFAKSAIDVIKERKRRLAQINMDIHPGNDLKRIPYPYVIPDYLTWRMIAYKWGYKTMWKYFGMT